MIIFFMGPAENNIRIFMEYILFMYFNDWKGQFVVSLVPTIGFSLIFNNLADTVGLYLYQID